MAKSLTMFLGPALSLLCASVLRFARQRTDAFQTTRLKELAMPARGVHKSSSNTRLTATLRSWCATRAPLSRWHLTRLALLSFAVRLGLATAIAWSAWQLIWLCLPLGAIRWGILVPATAAATTILFGGMLDFEAAEAERAVLGAKFTADRWGGRAETIRIHAQEYVRTHGRPPEGAHVLNDIYTGRSFTVVYSRVD